MSSSHLLYLDWLSLILFVCSGGYLGLRTLVQIRRQQRSYRKLPFPSANWRLESDSRGAGALVGIAVGDALGAPRESLPVWLCRLRYGRRPSLSRGIFRFMRRRGTVTDDTQQTWLVARALSGDSFPVDTFRTSLLEWHDWRIGPGRGTEKAILAIRRGQPVSTTSQGNGAAMRVAPLAVAYRDSPDRLREVVRLNAAVTHPNQDAVYGAQLVAEITRRLLQDEPLPTEGPTEEWTRILNAPQMRPPTGWIFDTVECALAIYVRHDTAWEDGLMELFSLGGDTDTVGAIYCSWVGAKAGAACFGEKLLGEIQGVELLFANGV